MRSVDKALRLDNLEEIAEAYTRCRRWVGSSKDVALLIDAYNDVCNDAVRLDHWNSCGDCRRQVSRFWKHIIKLWKEQ